MLTLGRLLDPRPHAEAARQPIADSVNIPIVELADRVAELPPRGRTVLVADVGSAAETAINLLIEAGRAAELTRGWEYGAPADRLWEPNAWLEQIARELTPGRALDLGCGAGRDALYLAGLGWEVVGVDRLPDALERAGRLAERYRLSHSTKWILADFHALPPMPAFDLVVAIRIPIAGLTAGYEKVGIDGVLVAEGFTARHELKHGRPSGASSPSTLPPTRLIRFDEAWRPDGSHMYRLLVGGLVKLQPCTGLESITDQ